MFLLQCTKNTGKDIFFVLVVKSLGTACQYVSTIWIVVKLNGKSLKQILQCE